jgi:predicted SnoaL-like aldol condensation-catalyzing enzyme
MSRPICLPDGADCESVEDLTMALLRADGVQQPTAVYDLYRMNAGKQVEHWDVLEAVPLSSEWKNANGKF